MLVLALLTAVSNLGRDVGRSLACQRKYPNYSAQLVFRGGGMNLYEAADWRVMRRSPDWAEIAETADDSDHFDVFREFVLKGGQLTVFASHPPRYTTQTVVRSGDALAQLYAIYSHDSKLDGWSQDSLGPACDPSLLANFLRGCQQERRWRRSRLPRDIKFNRRADGQETTLWFDAKTYRLIGFAKSDIVPPEARGDAYSCQYRFASPEKVTPFALPADAKRVDTLAEVIRIP